MRPRVANLRKPIFLTLNVSLNPLQTDVTVLVNNSQHCSTLPLLRPFAGSFRLCVKKYGALATRTATATATRTSKKQYVYYAKQQLCTCITLFCTFLYRPCKTTTWKCLIASFMEDVNKRRRISFSLSKLECGPQVINSRKIRLHFPFSANWNKRDKDWKNGNSF